MIEYGNIVLTLNDVLLPVDKLYPNSTPSMNEGLDYEIEYDLRLIGCELIQTASLLLKLPQTAVATGQVLFHRYFYSSSFVRRSVEIVAMACTYLAAKIEENARRLRDIINVFNHIKQVRSGKTIRPLAIDQTYIDRKNEVIKAERRLLKELGFCVYVKHPHKMITIYLKLLEKEREKALVQTAWNYMNDSLRTDVFLRFTPETIACACIDLAARVLQIPLPKNPPWYVIFGAQQDQINYIMISILRLYKHRPKPLEELEKLVSNLREKREEEKKKLRPDISSQNELENNSPSQQLSSLLAPPPIAQTSISSTIIQTTTTIVQQNNKDLMTTKSEQITNITSTTTTTTVNGNTSKKRERASSKESSTANHHHHHHRHHRSRRSRSSSSSRSQRRKKPSHRSRSRTRSSSRRRHKHHHHHSRSSNRRKKEKKHRSYSSTSSSSDDHRSYSSKTNKHPLSTKDTNHQSSKHSNERTSTEKKFKN